MAKRAKKRVRPTLAKLNELRSEVARLMTENSEMRDTLAGVKKLAESENARGTTFGEDLDRARGFLHLVLDELGADYATVLTNQIRRFLGRGGESELRSKTQRLLEKSAANGYLAIAD